MMMRREVFEEVGGLDERFALAYSDVDLCLRLRPRGYWIVWTPFAELYHPEQVTRGMDNTPAKEDRLAAEVGHYLSRWGEVLHQGDPFFTPNLNLTEHSACLRSDGARTGAHPPWRHARGG